MGVSLKEYFQIGKEFTSAELISAVQLPHYSVQRRLMSVAYDTVTRHKLSQLCLWMDVCLIA